MIDFKAYFLKTQAEKRWKRIFHRGNILIKFKSFRHVISDSGRANEKRLRAERNRFRIDFHCRCPLCSANDSFIRDLFYLFFFSHSETKKRFKDARLMLKYYEFFPLFGRTIEGGKKTQTE